MIRVVDGARARHAARDRGDQLLDAIFERVRLEEELPLRRRRQHDVSDEVAVHDRMRRALEQTTDLRRRADDEVPIRVALTDDVVVQHEVLPESRRSRSSPRFAVVADRTRGIWSGSARATRYGSAVWSSSSIRTRAIPWSTRR